MKKSIFLAIILSSTSVCFSQNSETPVKDVTSTNSTSKNVLVTPKPGMKEEGVGIPPKVDLGTPVVETYNPPQSPSDDNKEKKTSGNKNATKPR